MANTTASSEPILEGRLAPAAEDFLRQIRAGGFTGWSALSVEQGRAVISEMRTFAGPPEPVKRVEQILIPRPGGSEVSGELYIPDAAPPLPIMVHLHGGGWVLAKHTAVDSVVRALANGSKCAVLAVDY